MDAPRLQYTVSASRVDAHGSVARCKDATLMLDTDLAGRRDAFNPAELLLAALSACLLKGIERIAPMLRFEFRRVTVNITGERQDTPPKFARISYVISIDTSESEQRLALLHANLQKFGTVFNTVAPGTVLAGTIQRDVAA